MSFNPNEIPITSVAGPPVGFFEIFHFYYAMFIGILKFVAIILNWGLFGVLSLQVYLYSQAFPNDKSWLKILVCVVYLLEMLQTFLLTDTIWNMLVSGFGNPEALDEIGTTWLSVCIIGGFMACVVKWFYAYRIAVFSRKKIIPGIIIFMSLTSFSGAVAVGIDLKNVGRFSKLFGNDTLRTYTTIGLWEGTGFVCDVGITVCMCYYLHKRTQYGRFSQTDALVSKLIRMTIETGALTAIVSTLTLAMFYPPAFHNFTYFEVPVCVHAKFYSTTLLAVLNDRMKLGIVSESMTWRDNELAFAPPHPQRDTNRVQLYNTSTNSHIQNTTIHIMTEEVVTTDDPKVHCLTHSSGELSNGELSSGL